MSTQFVHLGSWAWDSSEFPVLWSVWRGEDSYRTYHRTNSLGKNPCHRWMGVSSWPRHWSSGHRRIELKCRTPWSFVAMYFHILSGGLSLPFNIPCITHWAPIRDSAISTLSPFCTESIGCTRGLWRRDSWIGRHLRYHRWSLLQVDQNFRLQVGSWPLRRAMLKVRGQSWKRCRRLQTLWSSLLP